MPVSTWLPTLPVPKSRNGVSLFALLSVTRSAATDPLAQTNGCAGFFCGTQTEPPGLNRHQNGPGEVGPDTVALMAFATSNRLLRFVGCWPGLVPRSSWMCLLRYCQTIRQGGSPSEPGFASSDANPAG